MANPTKQSVQLAVTADTDTAKTKLQDITKSIDGFNRTVLDQADAAKKGSVSLDELRDTQSKLKAASDALINQGALVENFDKLTEKFQTASLAANKLRDAYDAYKASLSGDPTGTEQKALDKLSTRAENAGKRVASLTNQLEVQKARLEAAGISTENYSNDLNELVTTADKIGRVYTEASKSILDFTDNQKKAKQAAQELAEIQEIQSKGRAAQAAVDAGAQPVYEGGVSKNEYADSVKQAIEIAEQRQAAEAAEQAATEKRVALKTAADAKDLESFRAEQQRNAERFEEQTKYNDLLARSTLLFDANDAAEKQAAEDKAFQDKLKKDTDLLKAAADQALATADGYKTLGQVAPPTQFNSKAQIQATLQPNVPTNIGDATQQVADISDQFDKGAKSAKELTDTLNKLKTVEAELVREAGLIDAVNKQQEAFDKAQASYKQTETSLRGFIAQQKDAGTGAAELANTIQRTKAQLDANAQSLNKEALALAAVKQTAETAGLDINNLDGEFQRLTQSAQQVTETTGRVKTALEDANPYKGKTGFLGLEPYQIQNLDYQIKDFFNQISSGGSVFTALEQQGSQVLVMFPKLASAVTSFILPLAGLAAVLYTVVQAVSRVTATEEAIRHWSGVLALSANSGNATAASLVALQREAEKTGATFEDAGKALQTFSEKGFDTSSFSKLLGVSQNLSKVLGVTLPQAADVVGTAFSGNSKAVLDLNEKYGFLSQAQLEAFDSAVKAGDQTKALSIAFDALSDHAAKAAAQVQGPLKGAFEEFRNAYHDMLDGIVNDPLFKAALAGAHLLAEGLANAAKAYKDSQAAFSARANPGNADLDSLQKAQAQIRTQLAQPVSHESGDLDLSDPAGDQARKKLQDEYDNNEKLIKKLSDAKKVDTAATTANNAATTEGNTGLAKRADLVAQANKTLTDRVELETRLQALGPGSDKQKQQDYVKAQGDQAVQQAQIAEPNANNVGLAAVRQQAEAKAQREINEQNERDAEQAAAEAEQLAEQRRKAAQALALDLAAIDAKVLKGQKDNITAQVQAVDEGYDKIKAKIKEFSELDPGGTINGKSIDEFTALIQKQQQVEEQEARQKATEDALNDTVKQRLELFKQIQDQVAAGTKTSLEGYNEIQAANAKLSPQIRNRAQASLASANAGNAIAPSPANDLQASRAQTAISNEDNMQGGAAATASNALIQDGLKKTNELVAARNDLVKSYNDLEAAGAATTTESEQGRAKAYADSTGQIEDQTDKLKTLIETSKQNGTISNALADEYLNKLKLVDAQTKDNNSETAILEKTAKDAFANSLSSGVDTLTKAIGDGIAGTKSWSDVFKSFGSVAISIVGDVAKAIEEQLIKKAAQQLASSAIGLLGNLFGAGAGAASGAAGGIGEGAGAVTSDGIATGVGALHTGGTVGPHIPMRKKVDPSVFVGARRYHTGGIAGLAPDETPAILQNGEAVLTKAQQAQNAQQMAAAKAGGGAVSVRQVLAFNEADIASAMAGSAGEKVFTTYINKNMASLKQKINR